VCVLPEQVAHLASCLFRFFSNFTPVDDDDCFMNRERCTGDVTGVSILLVNSHHRVDFSLLFTILFGRFFFLRKLDEDVYEDTQERQKNFLISRRAEADFVATCMLLDDNESRDEFSPSRFTLSCTRPRSRTSCIAEQKKLN
jgi:hypothetical protein